jgi:hypothetical protein
MTKPSPVRYRTTNWPSYNAALKKRGSLLIWLDKEMTWLAPHEGCPGRPAIFSDAAIEFCLTIKVLFKLPLRQTTGLVASLLRMSNLDWPVPNYSPLCRRQKTLAVQIPYRRSDGRLNLLVDSTGIKFLGDGEWQARKHGAQGRRQWRKVHLAMDTATSDIRAVEFTPSHDGDSPILPELLDQIPEDEQIGTVTAPLGGTAACRAMDGAYDTRRCHAAIIEHQATAIIPVRKNGGLWKEDCPAARARNETLRATRHFGRAFWKRWTGYHARSRIEAKMRCLKAFGERISARDPDRQTTEIQIRIALMNRFSASGRPRSLAWLEFDGERGNHASGVSSATTPSGSRRKWWSIQPHPHGDPPVARTTGSDVTVSTEKPEEKRADKSVQTGVDQTKSWVNSPLILKLALN